MRSSMSSLSFDSKFPQVSYKDLARETDGFSVSNLIGTGRYSSVYRGKILQEENVVAVKVFCLEVRGAQRSFIAECNALRNVRHRNLVRIVTACSSIDSSGNDFKALVYEFMPGGDLHTLLYSSEDNDNSLKQSYISLAQRLNIVVDIADAMAYLHHNHHGSIVHCDLKPSNILLDNGMGAHVGDFGRARVQGYPMSSSFDGSTSVSSLAIRGTIGYVAPGIIFLRSVFLTNLVGSVRLNRSLDLCNLQNMEQVVKFLPLQMFTVLGSFSLKYSYERAQQMTCSRTD